MGLVLLQDGETLALDNFLIIIVDELGVDKLSAYRTGECVAGVPRDRGERGLSADFLASESLSAFSSASLVSSGVAELGELCFHVDDIIAVPEPDFALAGWMGCGGLTALARWRGRRRRGRSCKASRARCILKQPAQNGRLSLLDPGQGESQCRFSY